MPYQINVYSYFEIKIYLVVYKKQFSLFIYAELFLVDT